MADAILRIIIDALNKAGDDLGKLKTELKDVDEQAGNAGKSTKGFGDSWAGVMTGINSTLSVIQIAGDALEKVYGLAKEGAELEYAAKRFDNLSESIGATANVLLNDLRDATHGMYSDAELMASAGDFMALGLAQSSDEVVRLSTVAGALGMNMNQLVLTLTNQTTMRFDALGVSVDGFDERLAALKETGMGVDAAFKEAFLQQAEEQIGVVGEMTDSSIGSFMRFEAQFKNTSNSVKQSASTIMAPAVANLAETLKKGTDFSGAMNQALEAGIITQQKYNDLQKAVRWGDMDTADVVEYLTDKLDEQTNATENARRATDPYSDSLEYAAQAAEMLGKKEEETSEQTRLFMEQLDKVTGIEANFGGMISLATRYDDILEEIATNELEIHSLMNVTTEEGIARRQELIDKNEELRTQMAEMANQVVLDMFMATIAIGGITEAEADAYFDLAADMKLISSEAAEEAKRVYGEAVRFINGLEIEDKSATFTVNYDVGSFTGVSGFNLPTESNPENRPIGGSVSANNPYLWQEYGYRGEVFVPSQNGYVLSRSDAERILAKAGGSNGGSVDIASLIRQIPTAEDIARAVRDAIMMVT